MAPTLDGNRDVLSSMARPVILSASSALLLASSLKAFPASWGLGVVDLSLQQASILFLLCAGLINASLYLAQRQGGPGGIASAFGVLLDLAIVASLLFSAAGQRSWFVPFLIVAVAAAAGTNRRWTVFFGALLAAGIFVALPSLQSAVGRVAESRAVAEQVTIVGMILAAGTIAFALASRDNQSAGSIDCWCGATARFLSLVLPCVLLGTLDQWAGLVMVIPTLIVAGTIQSPSPGTFRSLFTHLVAWCLGLAALAAGIATTLKGVLLADSLLPRIWEPLSAKVPQLQQPLVGFAAIFVTVFLISELALRALWPTRRIGLPSNT